MVICVFKIFKPISLNKNTMRIASGCIVSNSGIKMSKRRIMVM